MNYNDIEDKYIKAAIKGHYKFANGGEVKEVLGYDLRLIKGFKELENKELAEKLICGFLNNQGLQEREDLELISIKRDKRRFILKYKEGFSYLYDDGSVG